ncbi:MAG: GIY-YIG nuclease family protein [Deltaproteobacteria bacterium]|nr:GIY-YIG nuclease family protein [Deltaproteobacteria bacterium]
MIPERLVFLDLETTGVNPLHDRIIEVGLCEVVGCEVVEEWSTLVNPRKTVSPYIESITGIASSMVADAPFFSDIAAELHAKLAGKVLVAHNARFDYGFLKSEFRRLDISFQEKTLCTVKLSRALYPEHSRHNLDTLIERHNLNVSNRHRALGDVRATWEFFKKARAEFPAEVLGKAIQKQLKQPSLPPGLSKDQIDALPHAPGVYLFFGEKDAVLYVGKSKDIRARVLSHFSGDHRIYKGMRLSQQVRHIDFMETAGELGALLLEARLVKELVPIHNRRLRRNRELFTLCLVADKQGTVTGVEIVAMDALGQEDGKSLYGMFRSRREAGKTLLGIIREQGLCARVLGLEKGSGACFGYQIKKCRGACVGEEPLALHQARLTMALAQLKMRSWPFKGAVGIREKSPAGDRTEIHVFDHWRHLGTATSEKNLWEIFECPSPLPFDLDSYKILNRYLDGMVKKADILTFF